MSTSVIPPSAPESRAARPELTEFAPSQVVADEMSAPRLIGILGALAVVIGTVVILFNLRSGPRLISESSGGLAILIGIVMLAYHAFRDPEPTIRWIYISTGSLFIKIGLVSFLLITTERVSNSYVWVWPACFVLGVALFAPAARFESNPRFQTTATWTLLLYGFSMALGGIAIGNWRFEYFEYPGLLLTLLGLIYLWATIFLTGADSDTGYRTSLMMGILGAGFLLYALGRCTLPDLFAYFNWLPPIREPYLMPVGLLTATIGLLFLGVGLGMCSDYPVLVMTRRELASFFYSPIAYIVLLGQTIMAWVSHVILVQNINATVTENGTLPEPIVQASIFSFLTVAAVIFVVPAVCMRLLSEEQRSGSLEVLLTAPVNELSVALSKFLGGLIFFLALWIPYGLFFLTLRVEGGAPFDYRPLLSFGLTLAGSGAAFIGMGLFFSSLTKDQIVSAFLTFMGMILLVAIGFLANFSQLGSIAPILERMSFLHMWRESLNGKLLLRDVILQCSAAAFWIFLTTKILEARRWKA